MYKVLVLMSTYNGENYIRDQLDSIFAQKDVKVKLLVRDDGSSDTTINIIKELSKEKDIILYRSKNLGPAFSFLDLIRNAQLNFDDYDYYALSDQDDIWLPDKLQVATHKLTEENADLYLGSLDAFTGKDFTQHFVFQATKHSDFEAMLRNNVAGCTMVFSKKVVERIAEYNPKYLEMHDSWLVRVCQYTGLKTIVDKEPHMRYRIHGDNTCGAALTNLDKVKAYLKNVLEHDPDVASRTAHELLSGYKKYLKKNVLEYLLVLDKESTKKKRKIKLLKYFQKEKFSTKSRKYDFFFEVVTGKI